MIGLATAYAAFGAVLGIVGLVGIVISLVVLVRRRDPFQIEQGEYWIEHGLTDSTPHPMEGVTSENRHVIDPVG